MSTLPLALAHSAATPPRILTALARTPGQDKAVLLALAENASVPDDTLDALASGTRSETMRRSLLRNPAVDVVTATAWLTRWGNASVAVWREAIRQVEDPNGALATAALRHFPTSPWLPSEILESDTTSEPARLTAALALVSAPDHRLKQTERDRISDLAHRLPGTAAAVLAATDDTKLTTALTPLVHPPAEPPEVGDTAALAAWMSGPVSEDAVLAVVAGHARTQVWRAAARAVRPGWDRLAAAVVTAARAARFATPIAAYSIGNALLANPSAPRRGRAAAAALVARSHTATGYKPLRRIQRAARTTAQRNALARGAHSPEVVRWLAAEVPDLSAAALAHMARTVAETDRSSWACWMRVSIMRGLLARPELPTAARTALLASAGWQARALTDTGSVDVVLSLPWHDLAAVAATPLPALEGYRGDLEQLTLALAAVLGQRLGDPSGAAWQDVPVTALRVSSYGTESVVDGIHGQLVLAAAHRAAALAGGDVNDDTITHVMGLVVDGGFTGTLGDLATVVGSSLHVA